MLVSPGEVRGHHDGQPWPSDSRWDDMTGAGDVKTQEMSQDVSFSIMSREPKETLTPTCQGAGKP